MSCRHSPAMAVAVAAALLSALAPAFAGEGFPAPGAQSPRPPAQPAPRPSTPPPPPQPAPSTMAVETPPSPTLLGIPIYPGAQFLRSFDAGRGQRFYLYGTAAPFGQVVAYYKGALKTGGDLVFETPATHMFEVGRFSENTMAFPSGVTVKDYASGTSGGYPNAAGATPARFPTVIQIVPVAPGTKR